MEDFARTDVLVRVGPQQFARPSLHASICRPNFAEPLELTALSSSRSWQLQRGPWVWDKGSAAASGGEGRWLEAGLALPPARGG